MRHGCGESSGSAVTRLLSPGPVACCGCPSSVTPLPRTEGQPDQGRGAPDRGVVPVGGPVHHLRRPGGSRAMGLGSPLLLCSRSPCWRRRIGVLEGRAPGRPPGGTIVVGVVARPSCPCRGDPGRCRAAVGPGAVPRGTAIGPRCPGTRPRRGRARPSRRGRALATRPSGTGGERGTVRPPGSSGPIRSGAGAAPPHVGGPGSLPPHRVSADRRGEHHVLQVEAGSERWLRRLRGCSTWNSRPRGAGTHRRGAGLSVRTCTPSWVAGWPGGGRRSLNRSSPARRGDLKPIGSGRPRLGSIAAAEGLGGGRRPAPPEQLSGPPPPHASVDAFSRKAVRNVHNGAPLRDPVESSSVDVPAAFSRRWGWMCRSSAARPRPAADRLGAPSALANASTTVRWTDVGAPFPHRRMAIWWTRR